jgi:hypothetical protein
MLDIQAVICVSMKTSQLLKIALIPILTASTLLSMSTTVLADKRKGQGIGGDYRYELWATEKNRSYYLKIWTRKSKPEKDPPYAETGSFDSSRKALNYFDCYYAGKSLPECPKR